MIVLVGAVGAVAFAGLVPVFGPGVIPAVGGFALAAAVGAPFRRVTVTIDDEEFAVDFAAPWWPAIRLARERIRRVEVVDVKPWRAGGYGYRGSLRLFGRLAVVVRPGPGLGLDLTPRGRLIVTVDDAEGAAAVLGATEPPARTGGRDRAAPARSWRRRSLRSPRRS